MVERVYVEKRPGFDGEARHLLAELRDVMGIAGLEGVRVLNRYDAEGMSRELFEACVPTVFSEPQADVATFELPDTRGAQVLAVEYLPGQFDQRADSASECIQLISQGERPLVASARVYLLEGDLSDSDMAAIRRHLINPVEAREASLDLPATLALEQPVPAPVEMLDGFLSMDEAARHALIAERGLAMDESDLAFCQRYFAEEGRPPTITELKMIDTYWSDHCRHTTFGTELTDVDIADANVQAAFDRYLELRRELGREGKPVCLMDMGTIGARWLKARGIMTGLDESEEINACTVKVKVDVRGEEQDWLYLFKNETHNHPTEIEPFGGAATCVGGAIRDPLSGRAYVYQAMRVTGAADPTVPVADTILGKLPQRKLVTTAAQGYSSYGNQIGLATGQVSELYHPGYAAKRMEIGAVVGATPASDVRRETPAPGDVVVLLGGRTGRDGIGGATGSSKAHDAGSLESCGAEVQKGNAPVERKIQRLFRSSEACRMIKRCNDFGAGGVSVAIGELADGLDIDLDAVPKKYEGLDGTELAIAESQERMAVALAPEDVERFLELARAENLEATPVATVTVEPRVRMRWRGDAIVDVSRDFLASNGAPKQAAVRVAEPEGGSAATCALGRAFEACDELVDPMVEAACGNGSVEAVLRALMADINRASSKGLAERFDSTIGAATVLMPFGGAHQLTPAQAMVAKLPVLGGQTTTVSGLSWGFNPYLSECDPFAGAYMAVLDSVAKLVATGFERRKMYLTFQEYFEKLRDEPERWGKPVSALLGALMAQVDFGVGAIGGKDSMSGSFEDLDVPPTLVSFATAVGDIDRVTSPELKASGHELAWVCFEAPDAASVASAFDAVERLIGSGRVAACSSVGYAGLAETLFKMAAGNQLGIALDAQVSFADLFTEGYGTFVIELADGHDTASAIELLGDAGLLKGVEVLRLGVVTADYVLEAAGQQADLTRVQEAWEGGIEGVFPYRTSAEEAALLDEVPTLSYTGGPVARFDGAPIARPRVVIPVFPGTNCEYDTAAAFEAAGAEAITFIVNNLTPDAVAASTKELARLIRNAQMVMLPGGFSGGDEPDGSAKFITAFFRAPEVTEAVRDLLENRDGLMLGICNGFQALVKLGLVPYGDIRPMDGGCATLTFNAIGRHQSRLVRTRMASDLSPWLSKMAVGDVHTVAISHGEGRFVAPPALLDELVQKGQVAFQYVDGQGVPSLDLAANPNGSMLAIEGITSPDGRVLGKMGHSERRGEGLYKNVPGNRWQPLFEGGVSYFS